MDNKDLRIDVFTNSTTNVSMRITHMSTGAVVEGEGVGKYRLKKALIEKLEGILKLAEI